MEQIPRGVYTQEFRAQAVKLVEGDGLSIREAARRLSIPPGSLKNWLHRARAGKLEEVGKAQKPLTDVELELAWTRKELAEVKQCQHRMHLIQVTDRKLIHRVEKIGDFLSRR